MKVITLSFLVLWSALCFADSEEERAWDRIIAIKHGINNCDLKPLKEYISNGYDVNRVVRVYNTKESLIEAITTYASRFMSRWSLDGKKFCPNLKIEVLRILANNGVDFLKPVYNDSKSEILSPYVELIKGSFEFIQGWPCYRHVNCKQDSDYLEAYDWKRDEGPEEKHQYFGIKKKSPMRRMILDFFHKELGINPNTLFTFAIKSEFIAFTKEEKSFFPITQKAFDKYIQEFFPEQGILTEINYIFRPRIGASGGWDIIKDQNIDTVDEVPGLKIGYASPLDMEARSNANPRAMIISPDTLDHYLSLKNYSLSSQYCIIPKIFKVMKANYDQAMSHGGWELLKNGGFGSDYDAAFLWMTILKSYEYALEKFDGKLPMSCEQVYYFANPLAYQ